MTDANLEMYSGEVHGLVGQNGSGKSTLIKILAGYHAPESGAKLSLHGHEVSLPLAPGQFRQLGMSFVHQNLGLVGTMSVLDNLRVGRYGSGVAWRIPWRRERELVGDALSKFGVVIDPDTKVADLPQATRAVVAIARALQEIENRERGVLILDEPTASLAREAVDLLVGAVRRAASEGTSILFVSHRLDEVMEITDRISVLRDGSVVGTVRTADAEEEDVVEMIVGRRLEELYPSVTEPSQDRLLGVRSLTGGAIDELSFDVYAGEVLGLTGLLGSGFEEVPYLLMGATHADSGELSFQGSSRTVRGLSIRDRIDLGMVLVPANREKDGAAFALTVGENVTLPRVSDYFRSLHMDSGSERNDVRSALETFQVRPAEPERVFRTLSGGNQQKAILAKWLQGNPRILIMHEPTQGVDIGARQEIFTRIGEAARRGTAVILCSVEYEDLSHLCDRVLVFQDGRVTSELKGSNLDKDRIVAQCYKRSKREGSVHVS